MGGIANVAATGLCCCFSCCCQQCSDSFKKLLGPERVTKLFYIILIMVFVIPAIVLFFFINNWQSFINYFSSIISCPVDVGFSCLGPSAVYRLSFSLFCLFFFLMIMMICRNRCSLILNEGLFCFKYIAVLALFIGLLWARNSFFDGYAQASKYISIAYLVLQSIILIDLSYLAGIKLVKRYDEGQTCCSVVLIVLSLVGECIAVGLNVLGYVYSQNIWSNDPNCGSTLWVNIITTIILVVLPALQLLNFNHQNSLLTLALISIYISFLSFISQFSYTPVSNTCNRTTLSSLAWDVIISSLFFILSLYGTIMGGSGQIKVTPNGDVNKAIGLAPTEVRQAQQKAQALPVAKQEQTDEARYQGWVWVKWHFNMCLAVIYIGMLITNWTSSSIITGNIQSNSFGFWLRIAIAWVTALLYVWTLIAPAVCPDRDFTVQ